MPAKWQRIKIPLPETFESKKDQKKIADLVIERIVERTVQGKDKDGDRFPGYSKSYVKSLDFINAGKSKSKVDLQLSGDMLAALKPLKTEENHIVVGFEQGSEENARADGNIRGTYGQDTPNRKKARDFLGISESELLRIIKYVKRERKSK